MTNSTPPLQQTLAHSVKKFIVKRLTSLIKFIRVYVVHVVIAAADTEVYCKCISTQASGMQFYCAGKIADF